MVEKKKEGRMKKIAKRRAGRGLAMEETVGRDRRAP